MKKVLLGVLCLALVTAVVGCSSTNSRSGGNGAELSVSKQMLIVTPARQISSVTITANQEVQSNEAELTANGFSHADLQAACQKALREQNLLADGTAKSGLELEVRLTSVRIRSLGAAVVWAGPDYIKGTVLVRERGGRTLDEFDIDTWYALGGLMASIAPVRMNWLYSAFADEVVKGVTGQTDADSQQ